MDFTRSNWKENDGNVATRSWWPECDSSQHDNAWDSQLYSDLRSYAADSAVLQGDEQQDAEDLEFTKALMDTTYGASNNVANISTYPFYSGPMMCTSSAFLRENVQYEDRVAQNMLECANTVATSEVLEPGTWSHQDYLLLPHYDQDMSCDITLSPRGSKKRESSSELSEASSSTKRKRPEGDADIRRSKRRKRGACVRCRLYKEKCNSAEPYCNNCEKVADDKRVFQLDCAFFNLRDVVPFRPGNSRAGQTASRLPNLDWSKDYPELRSITIAQAFQNLKRKPVPQIKLNCRRFRPQKSDVLEEPYQIDKDQFVMLKTVPFACFDVQTSDFRSRFTNYLQNCQELAEEEVLQEIDENTDFLIWHTFIEARRWSRSHVSNDSTVNIALHILAKVHIAREQPIIVAGDILATWEADGYCAVLEGRPLIPSVLDFQLDTLLIESCRQGIIRLTKSLRKKVFSPKRQENWYEVFLTIAILLFALEEVHNGQIRYIRRTKIADANFFASVNVTSLFMIDQWRSSAKNLIYHFRCVKSGISPFLFATKLEAGTRSDLGPEALQYIDRVREHLKHNSEQYTKLRRTDLDNENGERLRWLIELFIDD